MSTRHDLVAERQLLAMALSGHPSVRERFLALPMLVWHPSHEPVATVVRDRLRRSIPVNAAIVASDVAASVDETHARRLGRLVSECSTSCPPLDTWPYYAEQVLTCFTVREADRHAQRLHQQVEETTDPQELAEVIRSTAESLNSVTDHLTHQAADPPISLQDLIDEPGEKYDWLVPGLWERMDRVVLTAFEGMGKALAIDTPIPTPKGWTTMGELTVGSEVFGPDGFSTRVMAATEVMSGRPCYRVTFSDGATIVADANHQWLTETLASREASSRQRRRGDVRPRGTDRRHMRVHVPSVVTTAEIARTLTARGGHALNHSIEVVSPLQYPAQELPVDPYVLGVWLGDGHSGGARITCADPEIVEEIRKSGVPCRKSASGKYLWSLSDGSRPGRGPAGPLTVSARLRAMNLLGNKHIPDRYLRGSVQQRLALIQGLMDTDGTVYRSGVCEFSVCSERLAIDVHEILLGLGVKASFKVGAASLDGRVVGTRFRINFQTELPVFRLPRKAERLTSLRTNRAKLRYITTVEFIESVPVRCIQVEREDGLFVAGRECITTHNSTLLRQFALCVAGGVHPFTGDIVNRGGHRVLVLDYENSRRQVRRKFQQARGYIDFLREHAALPPVDWSDQLRLDITPEGVDLGNIQHFARLEQKIAAAAPDLVVAGPIYRMSKLDIKDDQAAKILCDALDRLRVKYKFCLILEAHVGHVGEAQGGRKVRPFGSSLFLRWPEFGFGLRGFGDAAGKEHPDLVELVAWRGSREERAWPSLLKHSRDTLPWVVAQHDYEAMRVDAG